MILYESGHLTTQQFPDCLRGNAFCIAAERLGHTVAGYAQLGTKITEHFVHNTADQDYRMQSWNIFAKLSITITLKYLLESFSSLLEFPNF